MMTKKWGSVIVVGLVLFLSGCRIQTASAEGQPPEAVVAEFYRWYLDAADSNPGDGAFHRPLVSETYKSRSELSPELIASVGQQLVIMREQPGGGYDPFLCAQDIPAEVVVGAPRIAARQADVLVATSFEGHRFTVRLTRLDGAWHISEVLCALGS